MQICNCALPALYPDRNVCENCVVNSYPNEIKEQFPKIQFEIKRYIQGDFDMATVDKNKVEIFRAGKWNGDEYTIEDLDEIVKAHKEIGLILKPYLKLGHDEGQKLLQKDGYPSAGWITNVYREGKRLFADIKNIPKKIGELIDNKAYGRFSSEIYWNLKEGGRVFKKALKAVALLGADTPAVGTMDDFINLYETNNFEKVVLCTDIENNGNNEKDNNKTEDDIMTDTVKDVKVNIELENKDEIKQKFDEIKNHNKELEGKLDSKDKELLEAREALKEAKFSQRKAEVDSYLDKKIEEKKILPSQRESYFNLLMDEETEEKKYTLEDKKKYSKKELIESIIDNNVEAPEIDDEGSKHVKTENKTYSKKDDKSDRDDLDKKAKEYMKKHEVSYREAIVIVDSEGGE